MAAVFNLFNLFNLQDQGNLGGSTQKFVFSTFALTGVLFLSAKLLSFIRLIFSLFVLSGKPVITFEHFLGSLICLHLPENP